MEIPLLDLGLEHRKIREEIDKAIKSIIDESSFIKGKALKEFENNFAYFCDVKHCIGTSSGTAALYLVLKELKIGPGDEVITVPNTFIATIEAISATGAKPVFVDVDPATYLMDSSKVEDKITPHTKAIIPVHLYGQVVDMDPLIEIARKYNVKIIEDCCQAHGAEYKGKKVPVTGIGCFSFFPSKHLGGLGDGGAVVTNNDDMARRVYMLRDHGREPGEKHIHSIIGFNFRLDTLSAAVLNVKLKYLNENIEKRKNIAFKYNQKLGNIVRIPKVSPNSTHTYHLYPILVEERDELEDFLNSKGIRTGIHYKIPLHLQKAYRFLGYNEGDFPVAEEYAKKTLSLPMYPELNDEQIEYIVYQIKSFFNRSKEEPMH